MTVLKHEVDNLEGVPENLRPLYAEVEGKFSVPEPLRGIADAVTGLFTVNGKLRGENRDLLKKGAVDLSGLEDFGEDLPTIKERVKARLAELEEAASAGKEGKINLDKVRLEMKAATDAAVAKEVQKQERLRGQLNKYLVGSAATEALSAEEAMVELAMPFVERQVKVVEDQDGEFRAVVVDKDGDPRISGATGMPMTIRELVREMKQQDNYKPLFKSDIKGGGGSKPGTQRAPAPAREDRTPMDRIKAGLAARR